jgi:iron complex transport system substrate-binding protein
LLKKLSCLLFLPGFLVLGFLPSATAASSSFFVPTRVVSTNVCADQLVLLLADRAQIASLSRTVQEPALSNMVAEAKGIPSNRQQAEEILGFKPDLVISEEFRAAAMNAMLGKMGVRLFYLPSPQSLEESRQAIRLLAAALGHADRGVALVARMDAQLKTLPKASALRPRVIVLQAKNGTIGRKTLAGELIEAAGLDNLAGALGVERWGSISLEQVAVANPDMIIFETDGQAGNSLAQQVPNHPLFQHLAARRPVVYVPNRQWVCPGPWNLEAVRLLVKARDGIFH